MEKIRAKDDPRYQNLKKKHREMQRWLLQKIKAEYKAKELQKEVKTQNEIEILKDELKELVKQLKEKQTNI